MTIAFYIAAAIAIGATLAAVVKQNAVHALLYLIVSFLSVGVIFYLLGAPFLAALEIIIYAGAIIVLFLFVVMLLNLGPGSADSHFARPSVWIGPGVLSALLLILVMAVLVQGEGHPLGGERVGPKAVGLALFGPYLLAVQLAGLLLLAGLVGATHLRRRA
ncbi:MAG: NADH-quinone oxidoreductase subunit J [Opitutales bacterium]